VVIPIIFLVPNRSQSSHPYLSRVVERRSGIWTGSRLTM
jgi:hypothetical protein